VSERPRAGSPEPRIEREGLAASPGIALGPAYVVERGRVVVPHGAIEPEAIDAELERFRGALKRAHEQLEAIKARLPAGEHRQILKAHQLILRDPALLQQVEALVRAEQINVEWAFAQAVDAIGRALQLADDPYFRQRSDDVVFLGERVLRNLQGEQMGEIQPPSGSVVIALDLSPADTAQLARASVAAIVTAAGGQTSHTAIMARSLEIPAVVGVDGVVELVRTGDLVAVDATRGIVVVNPTAEEREAWGVARDRYEAFEDRVQREHGLLAIARDGAHVTLRANVALDEEVASAGFHGAEGIGLFRTEYLFMNRADAPTEEEHYRHAKAVLRKLAPYPVVFRTFDLGADKTAGIVAPQRSPANPALGLRSLRLALRERELFLAQLRGLLRAALHGPLRIMLPLVSGLSELKAALAAVEEAKAQLASSGMAHAEDVPVGVMIEMPSAAIVADLLATHVDFMSIGTNDLIQYTLAIDRDNDDVAYLYRPLHPAILRLIRGVVRAGEAAGISVSVCGEMAADPLYTWTLVGLGVRELSMHPSAIPLIKNLIRESSLREMEALAGEVMAASDADQAEALVAAAVGARFPEHLEHRSGARQPGRDGERGGGEAGGDEGRR
jgi:phosphotransferase system enzyme I (PtsI)